MNTYVRNVSAYLKAKKQRSTPEWKWNAPDVITPPPDTTPPTQSNTTPKGSLWEALAENDRIERQALDDYLAWCDEVERKEWDESQEA